MFAKMTPPPHAPPGVASSGEKNPEAASGTTPVVARRFAEQRTPLTFAELFATRVLTSPDAPAFFDVALESDDLVATPHSWADLDGCVRRAASSLAAAGVSPGDRALVCVMQPSRFLAFFLGAQAIGAIPVPLPSARELGAREAFRERIGAVLADCDPRIMVVDSASDTDALDRASLRATPVLDGSVADEGAAAAPPFFTYERDPEEIAFIQYTSGSTGSPKGVVVTHANLLANLRAIALSADLGPEDRTFNWLPLYHDMGLIGGFLLGMSIGGGGYMMPTKTFIGRPVSWLRGMSKFKATVASAPNFAYNLVARHLRDAALDGLDLSSWRRAFNGAEPIDRATLESFLSRFAPAGFRTGSMCPVYGLAEATLAVSIPRPDAPPRYELVDRAILAAERRAVAARPGVTSPLVFVSVGSVIADHRVRILDPGSDTELPERSVGEIAVSGPCITPFYFRKDAPPLAPRTELRTGDLGYVAEGELYIVDRLKDLLIVAGRNIVPSDLERVVASVPGTRYGAIVAFTSRGPAGTDELYIVVGATPGALRDPRKPGEIKAAVHRHFAVVPKEVILVTPSLVPKTSSGKVQRAACRELHRKGAFLRNSSETGSD